MKRLELLLFVAGVCLVILVKAYIYTSSISNYNADIYNYRAFSLLFNHTDEQGHIFPPIFQSRLGYEMPLNSYLYTIFFTVFSKVNGAEFVYDVFLSLLLAAAVYSFSKSKVSVLFISYCPYFLWPGYWTEKLFITLTLLAFSFYKSKNLIALSITAFLLLMTSTISLPLFIIYFVTVSLEHKGKDYWKFTIFLFIVSLLFFKSFLSFPFFKQTLINQNLNIVNNIENTNAINQLRGEDSNTAFQFSARILHNKLSNLTSIVGYSIRTFDPSIWFFNGEKNSNTGRQLIPILLPLYVLLLFTIPLKLKSFIMGIPILTASILIALNGAITQSSLLLLTPFVLILLESCFSIFNYKSKILFLMISIISFLPMINISVNYHPKISFAFSTNLSSQLTKLINENSNKNIYISDQIYPDLGPQLRYSLKILPITITDKNSYTYRPYIRNIASSVEIISPDDIRLSLPSTNSLFLVSQEKFKSNSNSLLKFSPIIFDNQNNPIFYEQIYEIPKK